MKSLSKGSRLHHFLNWLQLLLLKKFHVCPLKHSIIMSETKKRKTETLMYLPEPPILSSPEERQSRASNLLTIAKSILEEHRNSTLVGKTRIGWFGFAFCENVTIRAFLLFLHVILLHTHMFMSTYFYRIPQGGGGLDRRCLQMRIFKQRRGRRSKSRNRKGGVRVEYGWG